MNTVCEKIALHQSLKPAVLKQSEKEEEFIKDKDESLPWLDDLKPAIESTDSSDKESVKICPERIMRSRGERAEESYPTEVQIQFRREE